MAQTYIPRDIFVVVTKEANSWITLLKHAMQIIWSLVVTCLDRLGIVVN